MTDWDDPAARARLIDRVGPDVYNRLHEAEIDRSTVEVINNRRIRIVGSRFGRLYIVDGTGRAHATLEGARQIARGENPT